MGFHLTTSLDSDWKVTCQNDENICGSIAIRLAKGKQKIIKYALLNNAQKQTITFAYNQSTNPQQPCNNMLFLQLFSI